MENWHFKSERRAFKDSWDELLSISHFSKISIISPLSRSRSPLILFERNKLRKRLPSLLLETLSFGRIPNAVSTVCFPRSCLYCWERGTRLNWWIAEENNSVMIALSFWRISLVQFLELIGLCQSFRNISFQSLNHLCSRYSLPSSKPRTPNPSLCRIISPSPE